MRLRAMMPLLNALGSKAFRRQVAVQRLNGVTGPPGNPPPPEKIHSASLGGIDLTPSVDTQAVYVDNVLGNDSNDGLWPLQVGPTNGPKKTAPGGYAVLRTGKPDWLLFKAGTTLSLTDVYSGGADTWTKSGRSSSEPMVIGTYGGDAIAQIVGNGITDPITVNYSGSPTNIVHAGDKVQTLPARAPTGKASDVTAESGWSDYTLATGALVIYVDSGATDDTGDGLSRETAKKTINAGKALMVSGRGDWLLLKRGGTWDVSTAGNNGLGDWKISGASVTHPTLLGSYGPSSEPTLLARPVLTCPQGWSGLAINAVFSGQTPGPVNHLFVQGLEFASTRGLNAGTERGIQMSMQNGCGSQNIHIENCCIHGFYDNVAITTGGDLSQELPGHPENRITNLIFRRNVIYDAFSSNGDGKGQGAFFTGIDGLLIEENVWDRNGWGAANSDAATIFKHNVYVQNGNTNVTFRGNVLARSDGVQMRSGGTTINNISIQTAIAFTVGGGGAPNYVPNEGSGSTIGNLCWDGQNSSAGRGWAYSAAGNSAVSEWAYNMAILNTTGTDGRGFRLAPADSGAPNGNCHMHHNLVYEWKSVSTAALVCPSNNCLSGDWIFNNNDLQNPTQHTLNVFRHDDTASRNQMKPSSNRCYLLHADDAFANISGASGGDQKTFIQWQEYPGNPTVLGDSPYDDVGSTNVSVSYPDATKTPGTFHVFDGSINGVTPDGTIATLCVDLRLNRRGFWGGHLMGTYGGQGLSSTTGMDPTQIVPGKAGVDGVMRWCRTGFGMDAAGLSITSVINNSTGLASGPAAGGTAITINGTGFQSLASQDPSNTSTLNTNLYTSLLLGGASATSILVVSDTQMTAVTAAHAAGAVTAVLETGNAVYTKASAFTYT